MDAKGFYSYPKGMPLASHFYGDDMSKNIGGRLNCDIGKTKDEWKAGLYRDKIGNVSFALWASGKGFRDNVEIHLKDVKKMRDWLTRIINHVERP